MPARFSYFQRYQTKRHADWRMSGWPASLAEWVRVRERPSSMHTLLEITLDGDISDDGEIYALFDFDPEALSSDPVE